MTASLSVMFFGSESTERDDAYRLVRDASIAADELGFEAIWLPERHFDAFGGPFPDPAVLAAYLSTFTKRCHLRAGSIVAPLHDVLCVAEKWAMVDHMTGGGRVGVSLGSGWNANDFVLAPQSYLTRAENARAAIAEIRSLWARGQVSRINGAGRNVSVGIHPTPKTRALPLWLTASGKTSTFEAAGTLNANVLTHLLSQSIDQLADKIGRYRAARLAAGHAPEAGRVTLMLHSLATQSESESWTLAAAPLRQYLRAALELEIAASEAGGAVSGGRRLEIPRPPESLVQDIIEHRIGHFIRDSSFIGSIEKCRSVMQQVSEAGVDEVACLIDFGAQHDAILEGLRLLGAAFLPAFGNRVIAREDCMGAVVP